MFAVSRHSTIPHIVPTRFPSRTHVRRHVSPIRVVHDPLTVTPYSVQDFSEYASMQVIAWMLPMTIAGRVMGMEYKDIGQGLLVLTLIKTILKETGIIHF